ncbi:hypothetical protein JCM16303_006245 [Sporobolomyces ruberrimus]
MPTLPTYGINRGPERLTVVLISVSLLIFHLVLSSRLSQFSQSLRSVLDDNDEDSLSGAGGGEEGQGSLYAVITLLGISRLWSLCSAGIAGIGLYSIYKSNLPLLRLFTLNTFLSIALDLFLLLLTLILLSLTSSSSTSSSSHPSIATTLCQTLSNQNSSSNRTNQGNGGFLSSLFGGSFGLLPDLMGLSMEQCEEKFDGQVLTTGLTLFGLVEGVRGFGGIKLLGYYTKLAKSLGHGARQGYDPLAMTDTAVGSRRRGSGTGLRVDTGVARQLGGGEEEGQRYYDSPIEEGEIGRSPTHSIMSPGGSKGKGKARERENSNSSRRGGSGRDDARILVLPRSPTTPIGGEVPSLSLTPSTPNRTSFPPHPSSPSSSQGSSSRGGQTSDDRTRKILVYQPVMMTVEEAREQGASEIQLSKSPRSRSRSYSHSQSQQARNSIASSLSNAPRSSDRRTRSSTITPSHPATSPSTSKPSSSRSAFNLATPPKPPPSPAPSSASSRTVRQGSDDLLTPRGNEVGITGLLRGDLEVESSTSNRIAKIEKKRA